ncbi:MAG TPA: lectin like domain-containing protein [Lachnospiraceae bacterium]|nr:lectin like domain-containing protein [Lachnospiraceae bacterium]
MRKWFRSALAVLLAGVMMIPSGVGVLAGNTDSGITNDTIYNAYETPEYPRTAFIADDRPVDRIYDVADDNNIVQAAALESAYIPSGILTDSYPSIRNQNPYGTCWGFAPTSLAELSVLNNDGTLLDLSELHSIYFAYHYTSADGKDGVKYLPTASSNYLFMGGDPSFIYHTYANWVGAADEKTAPYSEAAATLESGLSNDIAMNDSAHLRNFYIVNKADRKYIKQLIKEYGGVGMSYYDDNQYYDYSTNSYYSTVSGNTNHAISVVGWDDDKVTNSSNKGAWLVRNSWGSDKYSHFGYFWMSYDEPSIYDRVYALDCVSDTGSSDDDFYDHNYQYDLSAYSQYGWIGTGTSSTIANIFTATGTQSLKAVGVETQNPNINYTVNIYTDIANSSNPESGTLVRTQTGSFTYQGFHTIKMDNPLTLTKGEKFSVVIKLESMDGKSGACYVMESKYNLGNAASWYCGGEKGQSFYYNYGWRDMVESMGGNVRIKAYTDDVQIQKPSAPSGLSVSNTIASLTLKWNVVTDATGYEIYRAGTDGKYSKITTVTSTSYVDTNVKNNTQYSYKIKAYNAAGASAFSTAASLKKTQISVSKLKADANGSTVQLSWTGGVTGAEGYVIYRRTEGGSYDEIGRTSGNTYSNTISAGIKYYYAVAVYSGSRTEDKCPEVGVMYLVAPSGLSVSNTIASLTLKWNAVKGATGYEIYRAGTDGKYSKITTVTSTSYVDTSVKNNAQYSYKIKAYNAAGASAFSTAASLKKTQISVSNLKADANGSKVQLSWTGGVTGAEGYVIYRRTEGGSYAEIGRTSGKTYSDTISAGIKYYYAVAVYSGSRTEGKCPEVGVMYLATPSGLSVSNTIASLTLKWNAVTDATGYEIYRAGTDGKYSKITTVTSTSYVDTSVKNNAQYSYKIKAYNAAGASAFSTAASLKKTQISVSNLKADANGSKVQLSWTGGVTGAEGYVIYRRTEGGSYAEIGRTSGKTYSDTISAGIKYYYAVAVYSGSRTEGKCPEVGVMYLAEPAVTGASNITSGVQVKWSQVTGATGYIVYRKGAGKGWARIADIKDGSTVNYTDTTAASGTTYTYTVRAYNKDTMSDWNSTKSLMRISDTTLTGASNITSGVHVKWSQVTGATGYIVYRKGAGKGWGRIADIKSGSTVSYTDTTAASGTTYTYTVRAYNGSTMGDWHSAKSLMRLSDTTVSGASNITYGVQVKWSRVTGATGYIVYRKGAGKGWGRIADIKSGSTVSYTDTTAASGTTYTYTVRAYNGSTMGDWHSTRSVKRLSDPKLTSAYKVSGGINVRWTGVTGATGYIVYRKSGSGSWGRIADIKSGSTVSYTDRTAKAGTTYTYTVRAYSGSTMGDWSSVKVITR